MQQPPKLDTGSKDIMSENLEKLKELFPSVIKDGTVDVEALKNVIGDISEPNQEYYNFTWAGKSDAFKIIKEKSKATLKPLKSDDESVDFENTGNIFIEGDNLEVLKILQKTYHNAIKMIYIDPPYNKDKDFVYPDKWSEGLDSYLEYAKLVDENGNITSSSAEEQSVKQGRKHSRWLTMMYPRLFLARNLLKDDGVIFISIDDDEVKNLRNICDEIFGEENFIGNICHKARASVSNDKIISSNHNHILLYAKNQELIFKKRHEFGLDPDLSGFDKTDSKGQYKHTPVDGPGGAAKGNPYYTFQGVTGYFRYSEETMKEKFDKGIVVKVGGGLQQKYYLDDARQKRKTDTTWWSEKLYTSSATSKLKELMGGDYFTNPKHLDLIIRMLKLSTTKDDIILDFFAGSGTTVHAVMALNAEDGGNRKSISIQLPEHLDKKNQKDSISFLESISKPTNIAEITKERIRRAGIKIKDENPDTTVDTGFKVFKLSESNFKKWDENIQTKEQLKESLDLFANNVKDGANSFDMLYEVILSKGLSLNSSIDEVTIGGKSMYKVNSDGVELLACFEDEITKTALDEVVSLRPIYFICLDSSFKNDTSLKTNSVLNFKDADILFETV
jgi:adenine-specific DNA-methyltransferase